MKAFDATRLPGLFTTLEGKQIKTLRDWEDLRRPEIVQLFTDQVFGRFPEGPHKLRFDVESETDALNGTATLKTVRIHIDAPKKPFSFPFWIFLPKNNQPCGATLLICNRDKGENLDLTRQNRTGFWPVEEIVARGYAAAAYHVEDIDTDRDDGFQNGIHSCYGERGPHDWATLSAWAFGAMRVMDYLEQDPAIDRDRVALVGQSRGGKTALFAGACDIRFRAVFDSNSGCVGTALSRFKEGESVRQINTTFPYWFCDAFKDYNDREFAMPFDQHMLLASIAPRFLYVTSSTEDLWSDPEAEWAAVKLAEPAYSLYGLGLLPEGPPKPDRPLWGKRLGYHVRTGEHDLKASDWMHFLNFIHPRW